MQLSVNQSLKLLIELIAKIESNPKYFVVIKKSLRVIVKNLSIYKNKYLANAIDVAIESGCKPKETKEYKIRIILNSIKIHYLSLFDYLDNTKMFRNICVLIRTNAIGAKVLLDEMFDIFHLPKPPSKLRSEKHSSFVIRQRLYQQEVDKLKREKKI